MVNTVTVVLKKIFFLGGLEMTTEQRTNLKLSVHLGKSPAEALSKLQQVNTEQALSRATVFLWHKRFKEEREDDLRCGRPSTSRNEDNVELVKKMMRGDSRLPVRLISDKRGLNRNSIWQILTEDVEMRKDGVKTLE